MPPVPTPTQIINVHLAALEKGRRRYNAYLFRTLLASLRDNGERLRADALEASIEAVSHAGGDPAVDQVVLGHFAAANKLVANRYQRKHLPRPLADAEAVRRRDLWKTYKHAAKKLSSASLNCRLVMVTLTVSNRHSWGKSLEIINKRRKQVRRAIGRQALWFAEAFDVQGPPTYSPHVHILFIVEGQACVLLSSKLRKKLRSGMHISWVDHNGRDQKRPLLPEWERRQAWLQILAYIVKVSGDCGERHFLDPPWDRQFQSVRSHLKGDGRDALNIQAMYGHYARPRTRIFRAGIKVRALSNFPAKQAATSKPKCPRGAPSGDPGRKRVLAVCRKHLTMKARAADLGVSIPTLRRWMIGHGIPTPRHAGGT